MTKKLFSDCWVMNPINIPLNTPHVNIVQEKDLPAKKISLCTKLMSTIPKFTLVVSAVFGLKVFGLLDHIFEKVIRRSLCIVIYVKIRFQAWSRFITICQLIIRIWLEQLLIIKPANSNVSFVVKLWIQVCIVVAYLLKTHFLLTF